MLGGYLILLMTSSFGSEEINKIKDPSVWGFEFLLIEKNLLSWFFLYKNKVERF